VILEENLVCLSARSRGWEVFTAPSLSSGAGMGWGLGTRCAGEEARGGSLVRFSNSLSASSAHESDGSGNGDNSGCIGRNDIEPYERWLGTKPLELRCSSGLTSRVTGLSDLPEYSEVVLMMVILREGTRFMMGGLVVGGGGSSSVGLCIGKSVPEGLSSSFNLLPDSFFASSTTS
jgi:hypothetical protein